MNVAERAALEYLHKRGRAGASDVGGAVWPKRRGRIVSSNGGGDYAAQMLLGRLRKQGLVRTYHTVGSSLWELTSAGRAAVIPSPGGSAP